MTQIVNLSLGKKNIWKISLAICLALTGPELVANAVHVPTMKGFILGYHRKRQVHIP
jgi:hypothetical protein